MHVINTRVTGGSGGGLLHQASQSCTLRSFISLCLPTLKRIWKVRRERGIKKEGRKVGQKEGRKDERKEGRK